MVISEKVKRTRTMGQLGGFLSDVVVVVVVVVVKIAEVGVVVEGSGSSSCVIFKSRNPLTIWEFMIPEEGSPPSIFVNTRLFRMPESAL